MITVEVLYQIKDYIQENRYTLYLCMYRLCACINHTSVFETIIVENNNFLRILLRDQNVKH